MVGWIEKSTLVIATSLVLVVAAPAQPVIPTNQYPLLDSWSFYNTNTWTSDFGYAPVSFSGLGVETFSSENALVVDSTNASWLQYNVDESDGTVELTVDQGSVLFWFASDWQSTNQGGLGPGGAGRLIEVGGYTTNATYGWWSLYFDAAGDNIYFSAQTNNGTETNYLSAPISWTNNYSHQIVLTYSSTNSALFVDGRLVTNGPGVTIYPGSDVLSNGFWMGSDSNGVLQARGVFGEVATYSNQLDASAVSGDYVMEYPFYPEAPTTYSAIPPAPSEPEIIPVFDAVTGLGYLVPIATNTTGCVNSNNVWMTNASTTVTTNGVNLTFTILGGSNGLYYDVFATTALVDPLTNGIWTWMGQAQQCVTYTIPALTNTAVFLLLGTPLDSHGNGLTDAYELLILHKNPANTSSGDGMLDGWKVLWGMNPNINNSANSSERLYYNYDGTGRLENVGGIAAEIFNFDAESNIILDQQ